jgi:DNA-binding NtrC family response regulator
MKKKIPTIPHELNNLLANYDFPGNIRELQGMIFDAVARHQKGVLSLKSFREIINKKSTLSTGNFNYIQNGEKKPDVPAWMNHFGGRFPSLKEAQEYLISEALRRAKGNQSIAASLLGMTRKALNKRLNKGKK